ncbi:MAG: YmdB family metallophosphoesterase [Oscillospiraceae bacterium]|nr:YmdB family metallophosphoesterase [Oscillospiraceae bacterium]
METRGTNMQINVLAVGDVCGRGGLEFLVHHLEDVKRENRIDFTVVNGENANVVGVKPVQCEDIFRAGADVITLGNHTWTRWEIQDYLSRTSRCLRPVNFAPQCPGQGCGIYETAFGPIRVINAMGRFSLDANTDNPFVVVDGLFPDTAEQGDHVADDVKITLVDFHAEATSEKLAMGYFLEGRASAVWGTHTHVQTSDCCVLPGGTGYITDLGMTGPARSVLGIEVEQSIGRLLGDPPRRYASAGGSCKMECAVFTIESETGRCTAARALRVEE